MIRSLPRERVDRVAAAWLAGRTVRTRTRLTEELDEAALHAEEAREADARAAVAEERRRIAREMHDIVAHSVSVMMVHAGGARRILDRDVDRAAGGGHGLVGMRERVRVFGGELVTGRRPGGGFEVRARIPVDTEAPRR